MDDIFDDLITEGVVVVYLDDILIFMETLEEHRRVTRRVMELLWKNNLFLKPEKCEFEQTEVEYLRVIISQDSVKMDPVKVAGVTEWPTPSNRREVQSFLGFTNFYLRFIQGFSHLARPLFDLTRKDTEWRWRAEEQSAFNSLKERITTALILALPDNLLRLHLHTYDLLLLFLYIYFQNNSEQHAMKACPSIFTFPHA